MAWKRIERVQYPAALFLRGTDLTVERSANSTINKVRALPQKSTLYGGLELAQGDNWLALFAALIRNADDHNDIILPHLPNAVSLYEAGLDYWLPIGVALDIPDHVQADFMANMREQNSLESNNLEFHELIILPKFTPDVHSTNAADVYSITERIRLGNLAPAKATAS